MWWRKKKEQGRRRAATQDDDDEQRFRRSRTLTGQSASGGSEQSESIALQSERLDAQKARRRRRRMGVVLVLLLMLVGVIVVLLFHFTGSVRVVSFAPNPSRQPDENVYEDAIYDYLRTRPLSRISFVLDEDQLSRSVRQKHNEVERIELTEESRQAFAEGQFRVILREPVVGWDVGHEQYWVDDAGVAFGENYFNTPDVTVRDESGIEPGDEEGMVASLRFLRFLGRVVALTGKHTSYEVEAIILPPGLGARSIEVVLRDMSFPVRMHSDRDPAAQVEDMERVIEYMNERNVTPEYIDVRVTGRAFYRE